MAKIAAGGFSDSEQKAGYRVLTRGYPSICDPERDGDRDYGSSYDYNPDGSKVYRKD